MEQTPQEPPLTPDLLDLYLGPRIVGETYYSDTGAGWECKPCGRVRNRLVFGIWVTLIGLLPAVFVLFVRPNGAGGPWMAALSLIFAALSALHTTYHALRRGFDFLYLDSRGFVHVRQMRKGDIVRTIVRFEGVDGVEFRGGGFMSGRFKAKVVGGRYSAHHGYQDRKSQAKWLRITRVYADTLRLHPRLLERLIQLAEERGEGSLFDAGLENAKLYLRDWTETTPEPIPIAPYCEPAFE